MEFEQEEEKEFDKEEYKDNQDRCSHCGHYLSDEDFEGHNESRPGHGAGEWITDGYHCPICGHNEDW